MKKSWKKIQIFTLLFLNKAYHWGIHTYLLSIAGDPAKIIPLLKSQPGCAFILYLHGAQITKSFLTEFHAVRNVMISICR